MEGKNAKLQLVDDWIVKILRVITWVSGVCLLAIMFIAFFDVLGNKIFKSGIPMSKELIQYLHIPMVFLAAAYVTLDRGHIKIDLLSAKFPPVIQRILGTIANLLGAFICGFIAYRGWVQMGKFIARHQMSAVSGLSFPLWPFALILAIGFAMLAFTFLWNIVRDFAGMTPHHAEPGTPEAENENGGEA